MPNFDAMLRPLSEKLEIYTHYRGLILENDYAELVSDSVSVFRFFKGASNYLQEKRLLKFLSGLSPDEKLVDEKIQRLSDYIVDEHSADLIAITFDNLFKSNSFEACMLMGKLCGKLDKKSSDITHEFLVALQALVNLFDSDINNIRLIIKYYDNNSEGNIHSKFNNIEILKDLKEILSNSSSNKSSFLLTLEKLINTNVFVKEYRSNIFLDTPEGQDSSALYLNHNLQPGSNNLTSNYSITESGIILFNLIKNY